VLHHLQISGSDEYGARRTDAERARHVPVEPGFEYAHFERLVQHGIVCLASDWVAQLLLSVNVEHIGNTFMALHVCYPGWMSEDHPQLSLLVARLHINFDAVIQSLSHQPPMIQTHMARFCKHILRTYNIGWTLSARGRVLGRQLFEAQWPGTTFSLARLHTPHPEEQLVLVVADATAARLAELQLHRLLCEQWGATERVAVERVPGFVVADGFGLRGTCALTTLRAVTRGTSAWRDVRLPNAHDATLVAWTCVTGSTPMLQYALDAAQTRVLVVTHDMLPSLSGLQLPRARTVVSLEPFAPDETALHRLLQRSSAFQDVFVYKL
jgi:hypothetical protein